MDNLNEADTRAKLVDPAIHKRSWTKDLIRREEAAGGIEITGVVFTRARIVVFCDGDFWHGHNWAIRGLASLEEELSIRSFGVTRFSATSDVTRNIPLN